jgi:hypothetical protein
LVICDEVRARQSLSGGAADTRNAACTCDAAVATRPRWRLPHVACRPHHKSPPLPSPPRYQPRPHPHPTSRPSTAGKQHHPPRVAQRRHFLARRRGVGHGCLFW